MPLVKSSKDMVYNAALFIQLTYGASESIAICNSKIQNYTFNTRRKGPSHYVDVLTLC